MLILIAHGSRDHRWRASVERVVEAVAADGASETVRLAYMDCTPPTLMDVASQAVRSGCKELHVLPLFLATEGHVERDIQPLVNAVREAFPRVAVALLPPIGQFPEFRDALARIAARTSPVVRRATETG